MRTQFITALTAAMLMFTAAPGLAHDRGGHAGWGGGKYQSALAVRTPVPPRRRLEYIPRPLRLLLCGAGDCRLKVRRGRVAPYYDRQNYDRQKPWRPDRYRYGDDRRRASRPGDHGHDRGIFRYRRQHQAWHGRHARKYSRPSRRYRRHWSAYEAGGFGSVGSVGSVGR